MIIQFEPSGTHIYKGKLKVRYDLFPESTDLSYPLYYFLEKEVGEKVVHPCLSILITSPETLTRETASAFFASQMTPNLVRTIDYVMTRQNSCDLIAVLMRNKTILSPDPVKTKDSIDLINSINTKLSGLYLPLSDGGLILPVEPQSIIIGPGATARAAAGGGCLVDQNVPADGTGTITTWQVYFNGASTGFEIATFFVVSGNSLSTRDSESIGNVASGLWTGTGLSTDVVLGDYPGAYITAGSYRVDAAGTGYWYNAGDQIPCTNFNFGAAVSPRTLSIYGTGVTPTTFIPKIIGLI